MTEYKLKMKSRRRRWNGLLHKFIQAEKLAGNKEVVTDIYLSSSSEDYNNSDGVDKENFYSVRDEEANDWFSSSTEVEMRQNTERKITKSVFSKHLDKCTISKQFIGSNITIPNKSINRNDKKNVISYNEDSSNFVTAKDMDINNTSSSVTQVDDEASVACLYVFKKSLTSSPNRSDNSSLLFEENSASHKLHTSFTPSPINQPNSSQIENYSTNTLEKFKKIGSRNKKITSVQNVNNVTKLQHTTFPNTSKDIFLANSSESEEENRFQKITPLVNKNTRAKRKNLSTKIPKKCKDTTNVILNCDINTTSSSVNNSADEPSINRVNDLYRSPTSAPICQNKSSLPIQKYSTNTLEM